MRSSIAQSAWRPGREVGGRYRVMGILGRGGSAIVHAAKELATDRVVAIKSLLPRLAAMQDARSAFATEAEAIVRLGSHPNIVRAYTAIEADWQTRLVCERMAGGSLEDRLASGPLGMAAGLECAAHIAYGLAYAHGNGLAHGDVKPSNVLFSAEGSVKVSDFGLAARTLGAPPRGGPDGGSRAGLRGTPEYMAPELWEGGSRSAASDAWAFGCMLYRMLIGSSPFQADLSGRAAPDISSWREAARSGAPRSLLIAKPDAPAAADELIRACLFRDPSSRPTDFRLVVTRWLAPALGCLGATVPDEPGSRELDEEERLDRADGLLRLGAERMGEGKLEEAEALFIETRAEYESLGSVRGLVAEACRRGELEERRGERAACIREYERAIALAAEKGEAGLLADALKRLGNAHFYARNIPVALGLYERSLGLAREAGDDLLVAQDLFNLGGAKMMLGNESDAMETFRLSGEVARKNGFLQHEAYVASSLARDTMRSNDPRRAERIFGRAIAIAGILGDRVLLSANLTNLGIVRKRLGRFSEAMGAFREALAMKREQGDRVGECRCLLNLAEGSLDSGEPEDARGALGEAFAIYEELGRPSELRAIDSIAAETRRALGDYAGAERDYRSALPGMRECGDVEWLAGALIGLARCLASAGKEGELATVAEEALATAIRSGAAPPICEAYLLKSGMFERRGDLTSALDAAARAAAVARRSRCHLASEALRTKRRLERALAAEKQDARDGNHERQE